MASIMEDIQDAFHFYDNKGDKKIAASQVNFENFSEHFSYKIGEKVVVT